MGVDERVRDGCFETGVEDELHAVATTDPFDVAAQMTIVRDGGKARIVGRPPARVVSDVLERGEAALAERLAVELEILWTSAIADVWPRLRAEIEADLAHRLRTVAESGIGAVANTLAPNLVWHGESI